MKIQVTSWWGSSPKLASDLLLRRVVKSHRRVVSHLLLLPLLHGVDPLTDLLLPCLRRLDVRV
jgi:hypothetical protein